MPTSGHSSTQWIYSFGSYLLCPNLPSRVVVVEQQKSHAVPDAPMYPGNNAAEVTGADCERNLCVIWLILRTCWIPESTLNQPAADRPGVITSPSSHNWFIIVNVTLFPLAHGWGAQRRKACSMVCPRAREHLFSHKKSFTIGKQGISHTWRHPLSLQGLPEWKRLM